MMDSRQQGQDPNQHNQHAHNYSFSTPPNDTFSFLHSDADPTYSNTWDTEAFHDPQDSINGFHSGSSTWDQTTIQPGQLLPTSSYGTQSRNLDQTFSGNPTPYTFSGSSFDNTLSYGPTLIDDTTNFEFTRNQPFERNPKQSETVSPQALQNYPGTFSNVQISEARPVSPTNCLSFPRNISKYPADPSQSQQFSQPLPAVRRSATGGNPIQASVTRQDWRAIVSAIPKGTPSGIFTIQSSEELKNATNSSCFKGFMFIGNSTLELSNTKGRIRTRKFINWLSIINWHIAIIPRYNQRRSKNEIWHLLLQGRR